jgi:hypothetical protein
MSKTTKTTQKPKSTKAKEPKQKAESIKSESSSYKKVAREVESLIEARFIDVADHAKLDKETREKILAVNKLAAKGITLKNVKGEHSGPKRPRNAFMFFVSDARLQRKGEKNDLSKELKKQVDGIDFDKVRKEMKKSGEQPGKTRSEAQMLSSELGKIWKTIKPADKKVYDGKAGQDKDRYEEEVKIFKKGGEGAKTSSKTPAKSAKKTTSKKKKDEEEDEEEEEEKEESEKEEEEEEEEEEDEE